jgi:PAS domain S-box-containing protein
LSLFGKYLATRFMSDTPLNSNFPSTSFIKKHRLSAWLHAAFVFIVVLAATVALSQSARFDQSNHLLIYGFGVLLSCSLAWLTLLLVTCRMRAFALAEKLTAELRSNASIFQEMADMTPAMIWTMDTQGKRAWVNKRSLDFVGIADLHIFTNQWRNLIHPDDRDGYEKVVDQMFEPREAIEIEYRVRRYDGEYRWILSTGVPRYDELGQFIGFIGSGIDITARKNAEDAMKQAAMVYQNSSEAMIVFDFDFNNSTTTIIDTNPAFTLVTGYSRDDVIGKGLNVLRSEEGGSPYYDSIRQSARNDGHWEGEYILKRKNGEKIVLWLNVTAVDDPKKERKRYVALSRDLTKQKEFEETIRSLSTSLISAKEDEARRIAREIHDDLGQRLSWLRINLMLLPKLFRNKSEELNDMVGRMRDSIDVSLRIVRDIASNLRPAPLDMGFIMAVEWQIEDFLANTGIQCTLDNRLVENFALEDDCATGVFRILQEALTNVARHAKARNAIVALRQHKNELVLEISDNGAGFDSEPQRKRRSNGLAGMRERAAMLGGQINIVSQLGQGSTVTVTIPLN